MATLHATDDQGTEVIVTAPSVNEFKVAENIDSALSEAHKESNLSSRGKDIVEDTQALLEHTRKHELFQKLFTFARQGVKEGVPLEPSDELTDAARTLMSRVTNMGSSLQTDAEDVFSYIRGSIYNFLTSAEYRDLASDFFTIMRALIIELEDQVDDQKASPQKKSWESESGWQQKSGMFGEMKKSGGWGEMQKSGWEQGSGMKSLEKKSELTETKPEKPTSEWDQKSGLKSSEGKSLEKKEELGGLEEKAEKKMKSGDLLGDEKTEELKMKTDDLHEETIEDIRLRLNAFLKRVREKKEYQALVENFFKFSDQLYETLIDVTEKAQQSPEAQKLGDLIDQSFDILSEFAGEKLVQKYRKDLTDFFTAIKEDQELKDWRESTRSYVREVLQNPQIESDTDESKEKVNSLIRKGRQVLEKYKEKINGLYNDNVKISQKIRDDPVLKEFETKLSSLGSHLILNDRGEIDPMVMQESMGQITNLMAGLFHKYLSNLPLDKVEIYTPEFDVVLKDVKVEGQGFAPDEIEIGTRSHSFLSFAGKPNRTEFQVTFSVAHINPSFKDFEYEFEHKTFPAYQDAGRASINCGGDGLSVRASLLVKSQSDRRSKAVLQELSVRLGSLSIVTGQDTQHQILSRFAAPIFAELLRSRVEFMIYRFLYRSFGDIVTQLNDFFESSSFEKVVGDISEKVQSGLSNITEVKKDDGQEKGFVDTMKSYLPSVQDIKEEGQAIVDTISSYLPESMQNKERRQQYRPQQRKEGGQNQTNAPPSRGMYRYGKRRSEPGRDTMKQYHRVDQGDQNRDFHQKGHSNGPQRGGRGGGMKQQDQRPDYKQQQQNRNKPHFAGNAHVPAGFKGQRSDTHRERDFHQERKPHFASNMPRDGTQTNSSQYQSKPHHHFHHKDLSKQLGISPQAVSASQSTFTPQMASNALQSTSLPKEQLPSAEVPKTDKQQDLMKPHFPSHLPSGISPNVDYPAGTQFPGTETKEENKMEELPLVNEKQDLIPQMDKPQVAAD